MRSDLRQAVEIRLQHVALQHEVGEFAFAHDLDEAGGFQLFHMVRERGGADVVAFADCAAGEASLGVADLLQYLVATGKIERQSPYKNK